MNDAPIPCSVPAFDDYDTLLSAYVASLRDVLPAVQQWWQALERRTLSEAADPRAPLAALHLRWPCGVASHPRVIAVFRRYFLAVEALNARIDAASEFPALREYQESDWGDVEEGDGPVTWVPSRLLIDRLEQVDAGLWQTMTRLAFIPIGSDPDGAPA